MKSKASVLREAKLTVNMIFELQKVVPTSKLDGKISPSFEEKMRDLHRHLNTLLWVLEMTPEDVGV